MESATINHHLHLRNTVIDHCALYRQSLIDRRLILVRSAQTYRKVVSHSPVVDPTSSNTICAPSRALVVAARAVGSRNQRESTRKTSQFDPALR
jgi:hypothetical protein